MNSLRDGDDNIPYFKFQGDMFNKLEEKLVEDECVKHRIEVAKTEYEHNFPSLVSVKVAQANNGWANIAEGNQSKTSATALEYVEPMEADGIKCI